MKTVKWIANGVVALLAWNVVDPSAHGQATRREAGQTGLAKVDALVQRGGCGNCHIIPGIAGADGTVGPSLAEIGKFAATRKPKLSAAGYIRESIVDPEAFIAPPKNGVEFPSGVMPTKFGRVFSKMELDLLVEHLASLGIEERAKPAKTAKVAIDATLPTESSRVPFQPLPGKAPPAALVALGRFLFHDSRLSNNNSLSCASCHRPEKAFTDGMATSDGYPSLKLFRNTPTLLNVAFAQTVYWDGRMSGRDLGSVVRDHLTEAHFMASDGRLLVERVKQVPAYVELFRVAAGSEPSFGGILNAVAAYVQTLNSTAAPIDRYLAGDFKSLSMDAKAGWDIFRGKAGCARCHPAPLFSDQLTHDLGLPANPKLLDDPERHIAFRRFFRTLGVSDFRMLRGDIGHAVVTMKQTDRGKFRTPSLREVERTAPYMHDGRFATLEAVIDFYDAGGGPTQRAKLAPLSLTPSEKGQLLAFLRSLTGDAIMVKTPHLPDYELMEMPRGSVFDVLKPLGPAKADTVVRKARPLGTLPKVRDPLDNPSTPEKVMLGRLLFFDPRMSADAAVSCNTCHPANTGYTARTPISMGGTGTSHWRNSSHLYNLAHFEKFNWDGARTSIEDQNDGAWNGAVAGNLDLDLAEERLAQIPEYRKRFTLVFGERHPTWSSALRAVAAYQRTLVSKNVPFDRFLEGNQDAIGDAAKRGLKLFEGKARCIQCHDGPLLSDDRFHALGVPVSPEFRKSPIKQITFRYEQLSLGVPRAVYDATDDDLGLYYVTKRAEDVGKFRTPTLRELKHTAPYMHNGIFRTLEEVVDFYNQGGGPHPNRSPRLQPLNLTNMERRDLAAFLECLSGDPLVDRPPSLPPYGPHGILKEGKPDE